MADVRARIVPCGGTRADRVKGLHGQDCPLPPQVRRESPCAGRGLEKSGSSRSLPAPSRPIPVLRGRLRRDITGVQPDAEIDRPWHSWKRFVELQLRAEQDACILKHHADRGLDLQAPDPGSRSWGQYFSVLGSWGETMRDAVWNTER